MIRVQRQTTHRTKNQIRKKHHDQVHEQQTLDICLPIHLDRRIYSDEPVQHPALTGCVDEFEQTALTSEHSIQISPERNPDKQDDGYNGQYLNASLQRQRNRSLSSQTLFKPRGTKISQD